MLLSSSSCAMVPTCRRSRGARLGQPGLGRGRGAGGDRAGLGTLGIEARGRVNRALGRVTTALNLTRSRFRRLVAERRAWPRLVQPASMQSDPDHIDVRRALERLPRRQREAIVLRYYLDLDVREVAAVMRIEEGTAKSTLARAREALGHQVRLPDPEVEPDANR